MINDLIESLPEPHSIKYFTAGISYQEHLKKAQTIYDNVVKPQIEVERKLEQISLNKINKKYE